MLNGIFRETVADGQHLDDLSFCGQGHHQQQYE